MAKQARKQKRSKAVGPKYPAKLLKELGEPLELNDRKRRHSRKSKKEPDDAEGLGGDVYEYEEGVPQEESGKNRRFDQVDKLEYELPKDFEDEEIDEDAAFGEENPSRGGEDDEFDLGGSEDEVDEDEEGDEELHDKMLEEVTGKARHRGRKTDGDEEDDGTELEAPITVDDLLVPLQEQPGFNALKKKMRALQKHAAPVAAPLPRVLQEKLDRKAGYEKTSEEISKWQPLVKKNREAATINFVKDVDVSLATTGLMAADFKPSTNLEKEIDALLHESRVYDDHQVEVAENLELNKLSVEEVKNRQERLAKMRSLLFRHEERAKRLKKIKSKAYHRMTRKAMKAKPDLMIEDPEQQKEEAMKQEINRARERMTLKHKNTTRWAKRILKRGIQQYDDGTREAITEQLRKHALLTQKINAVDGESSSSDEESELDEDTEGLVLESKKPGGRIMARAKMAALKELEEGDNEAEIPKTGIFSLPFMVRAIEKKRKEAENEAKAVLEELEQGEAEDAQAQQEGPLKSGKLSFGGFQKTLTKKSGVDDEEPVDRGSDSENSDYDTRPAKSKRSEIKPKKTAIPQLNKEASELQGLVEAPAEHTLRVDAAIAVDETSTEKAKKKKKNKKKNKKAEQGKNPASQTHSVVAANPTIFGAGKLASTSSSEGNKLEIEGAVAIAGRARGDARASEASQEDEDECASDEDEDELEEQLIAGRSQEELIREAFAGDDVGAEFERLKSEAAEREAPQGGKVEEEDLPGWGQWTDIQKKRGPPKWLVKKQEELRKQQEAAKQRRLDAKLKNVIVSEKVDKKAAKFMTSLLPFPFTSAEVFENSIRMPLGPEFNTSQAFHELTRPAEIKRAGVIIDPIEYEKSDVKKRKLSQQQQAPSKASRTKLR